MWVEHCLLTFISIQFLGPLDVTLPFTPPPPPPSFTIPSHCPAPPATPFHLPHLPLHYYTPRPPRAYLGSLFLPSSRTFILCPHMPFPHCYMPWVTHLGCCALPAFFFTGLLPGWFGSFTLPTHGTRYVYYTVPAYVGRTARAPFHIRFTFACILHALRLYGVYYHALPTAPRMRLSAVAPRYRAALACLPFATLLTPLPARFTRCPLFVFYLHLAASITFAYPTFTYRHLLPAHILNILRPALNILPEHLPSLPHLCSLPFTPAWTFAHYQFPRIVPRITFVALRCRYGCPIPPPHHL